MTPTSNEAADNLKRLRGMLLSSYEFLRAYGIKVDKKTTDLYVAVEEALKTKIPLKVMKANVKMINGMDAGRCGRCGAYMERYRFIDYKYCPNCGQAVSWEGDDA